MVCLLLHAADAAVADDGDLRHLMSSLGVEHGFYQPRVSAAADNDDGDLRHLMSSL